MLNVFGLYLFLKSIVDGNIYKYYLSVIMLINNAAITLGVLLQDGRWSSSLFWKMYTVIACLYVLEAIISVIWLYVERNENNITIYKKIGLNPKINEAFAARKRLETLCEINIFMSSLLQLWFLVPPNASYRWLEVVRGFDTTFTYIQQLFISVNFNSENASQRMVAIIISIFNICFPIVLFIFEQLLSKRHYEFQSNLFKFIYIGMLLITIFMSVFLIQDYNRFGSGLKEYMKFKTKRLQLSSHSVQGYD